MTSKPVKLKIEHKDFESGVLKNKQPKRSLLSVTREATILTKLSNALQAQAGSTFRTILVGFAGIGLTVVVVGLVTGLIPPPKHAMADSSRIVSLYFDGQKKVITTNASTVRELLDQSSVNLSQGDIVEPGIDTEIPVGFFNVNVYRSRPVVVVDGLIEHKVTTASQSPRLIAEMAGFRTYPEDDYDVTTIDQVANFGVVGQKIVIQRATPVYIKSDGNQLLVRTQQKTVDGLLHERDVALGPQDKVEPPRDTPITPNMVIEITRVKNVVLHQTDIIPREVKKVKDDSLDMGVTKVQTEGADGEKVSVFKVNYQNGVEKHRELVSQQVTKQPVTKVVVVGTKINLSADPVSLGKQMAAQRGWTGAEWDALYKLWDRESGWNPDARNFWSGACGIPQAYPCSKLTDKSVAGQIRWGLDYIAGKYGAPSNAYAYWQRNNSY